MTSLTIGFEQILQSTLRMARKSLGAELCAFLQFDDGQRLCVRAVDGTNAKAWQNKAFPMTAGPVAQCIKDGRVVRVTQPSKDGLLALLKGVGKKSFFTLVPVSGQSRTLGVLVCGPHTAQSIKRISEEQLRNTGALCAVLTAHWRLYEWLSSFTPQVNHELRTPLTAVQGSLGMVLGGMYGQVGGEMRQMLEMAQRGCERTVLAIEEYISKQLPNQSSELEIKEPKKKSSKKKR